MKEEDLKIITNDNNIFNIQIYIPIGSIHETKGIYGIAHFLEHIKHNRSKKYDTKKLRDKLSNFTYNASTTYDHTKYYITADSNSYEDVINLIKEVVFNTSFTKNEIEKERKIVFAEKVYTSTQKDMYKDINIYHDKNPYNRLVIGTTNNLKKISNKDFKKFNEKYLDKFYVFVSCPNNIKNKIKKLCLKKFPISRNKDIIPINYVNMFDYKLVVRNAVKDKQLLILTFKSLKADDSDIDYLGIFDFILAKGKKSKLVSLLREDKGIIYRVETTNNSFRDNGFYMIKLILKKDENGKDVIKLILDEFKKLKKNNLSKNDLDEYKRKYIEKLKVKLKETQFKNDFVFSNLFYNPNFTLDKFIKKNEDVTTDKINNIIMKILNFHQMNITLYGNFMDINKTNNNIFNLIEKIRK